MCNAKERLNYHVLKASHLGIYMVLFKEHYATSPEITAHAHGTFFSGGSF